MLSHISFGGMHFSLKAVVVVRRAIAELGGTMPEDLPTADSIRN